MRRKLLLSATFLLAACSAGEAPRIVAPTTAEPTFTDFGTLRVRYHALPSLSLNEETAKRYGVGRGENIGLLVVSLRDVRSGEEDSIDGRLGATVTDLQGERQAVAFRPMHTGGYTDYVGVFAISPRNHYRIKLDIEAQGRHETVNFQREF